MIALYAFWALGEWKTTFAVFLFDKLDCKFAYRLFGSDTTTKIFTFLYANLRWYSHLNFIFVAMESQYSMLLGWMILSILSAGWSWAAFSQLNVIIIIPESQMNKRFMKKQHIHVGTRAPITNKQVWGQPPPSFKAKRFEALSNFEKKGPYSEILMLSSENFGDNDIMWHPEKLYADPLGWYQKILMISPEFMAGNVRNYSDDIPRQVR